VFTEVKLIELPETFILLALCGFQDILLLWQHGGDVGLDYGGHCGHCDLWLHVAESSEMGKLKYS
jgi:hypothetical protein